MILSSPATQLRGKIDIIITKPNGNIMFGGTLNINENKISFSLQSASQQGGFPLIIEANLVNKELKIERAEFSTSISVRKQPKKTS
jgi:predicted AAA+ superfamily ATPase